jgi:hypothetical protein
VAACNVPLLGGVSCAVGALAHGAWTFVTGDDLATLRDAHVQGAAKFLAIVDLSSNALILVPVFGEGVEAAKLALKAAVKVGAKVAAREISYDEAKQLALRLARHGLEEAGIACVLCFPAGMLVATTHRLRAIQRLRAGDTVLAENPATGKVEAEPVQALSKDPVAPLIAVELSDGSAITVTADHPFWMDAGNMLLRPGWLRAGCLRRGDHLRTASGVDVVVTGLRYNVGHAAVYTLTVAHDRNFSGERGGDYDFFVGTACVLVHDEDIEVDTR